MTSDEPTTLARNVCRGGADGRTGQEGRMTDRELLEWAAKSAGYVIQWGDAWGRDGFDYARINGMVWNPLTDDGDALRLAVKLQIHVQPDGRHAWASTLQVNATEEVGDDPCAATRRAIVRAAAEIGRAL